MDQLTNSNLNIVRAWGNKLDIEFTDLFMIGELIEEIVEIIEEFDNLETKKRQYSTLLSILRLIDDPNVPVIEQVFDEITTYLFNKALDNELSDNEYLNWVHYDDLIRDRNALINLWMVDLTNLRLHYKSLILSLYTMLPPVRVNYIDMPIYNNMPSNKNTNQNFIYVDKGKVVIYINDDKMSNIAISKGKNSKPLVTTVKGMLRKIILKSIQVQPRKYLLTSLRDVNKPMSNVTFNGILGDVYENKNLTVTLLRHVYITNFLNKNPTTKQKYLLAIKMRHSYQSQSVLYNRYISEDELKGIDDGVLKLDKIEENIPTVNISKNVRRMLAKYNNEGVVPRKSTIDKYGLVNNNGVWYVGEK